jgi:hypothetical protein
VSRKPLLIGAVGVLAAGALGLAAVDAWAPPQHLPWKPLTLGQPIGMATHAKIARLAADPPACRAVLAAGGVRFRPGRAFSEGPFCAVKGAGGIYGGLPPLSPSRPVITCGEALGLAVWERQSVLPASRDLLGSQVMIVDHLGTYACRDIRGGGPPGHSQHAYANAIDIAGFRLGDGRRITVAAHYRDPGPRGAFLRKVRKDACRVFGSALGPDYNGAHRDHLHLDMGDWGTCR